MLRAFNIIGLALCFAVCARAQAPELLLKLVPPVEVKKFVWDGGGASGALVDANGEVCRFSFDNGQLSNLEYLSAAGARREHVEAGDPRSSGLIEALLSWVDQRFSVEEQLALSVESRDAHTSAYRGGVIKIATTPGMRAASLADTTSPCGPITLGDSTEVWVDWPETPEDVAWFILSKFRFTPEGR